MDIMWVMGRCCIPGRLSAVPIKLSKELRCGTDPFVVERLQNTGDFALVPLIELSAATIPHVAHGTMYNAIRDMFGISTSYLNVFFCIYIHIMCKCGDDRSCRLCLSALWGRWTACLLVASPFEARKTLESQRKPCAADFSSAKHVVVPEGGKT